MDCSTISHLAKTAFDNQELIIKGLEKHGKNQRGFVEALKENKALLSSIIAMLEPEGVTASRNLLELPTELLFLIMSKLPDLRDLVSFSQVCKRIRMAASDIGVSTLSSAAARQSPKLLKDYLDRSSEELTLNFGSRECIEFPPGLERAIFVGNAMPNLKLMVMKNGVLDPKFFCLKDLPLNINSLTFLSLQNSHGLLLNNTRKEWLYEPLKRKLQSLELEVWFAANSHVGLIAWQKGLLEDLILSGPEDSRYQKRSFYEILSENSNSRTEHIVSLSKWDLPELVWPKLSSRKVLGMKRQQLTDRVRITIFVE
jgi:hypothetical protein